MCKKINANVQTVVEVYRQGDKNVLPTGLEKLAARYLSLRGTSALAAADGFHQLAYHRPSNNVSGVKRFRGSRVGESPTVRCAAFATDLNPRA